MTDEERLDELARDLAELRERLAWQLAVPNPAGQSGKVLGNNGSRPQWVPGGGGGGSSAVQLTFGVGPVGTGVTTGVKRTVQVFDEIELTGWALAADAAGTLELDVWVSASFPPAVGDSIVASAPPELVSAASATGGVSGWTTTIPAGSWVTFAVTAVAGVTRFDLALAGTRS